MDLAINARFSQKTKYINIRYYFIRNYINIKEINFKYISIGEIITNILIKPLPRPVFELL
jgi:hypothetical protein